MDPIMVRGYFIEHRWNRLIQEREVIVTTTYSILPWIKSRYPHERQSYPQVMNICSKAIDMAKCHDYNQAMKSKRTDVPLLRKVKIGE